MEGIATSSPCGKQQQQQQQQKQKTVSGMNGRVNNVRVRVRMSHFVKN